MAGPIDRRIVRHARAARVFLVASGGLALVQALATIAIAAGAAGAIAAVVTGGAVGEMPVAAWVGLLAGGVVLRALALLGVDELGARGAARVKRQLRGLALDALARRGADAAASGATPGAASGGSARTATVLTTGLDALDGYLGRYLPQLVLTAVAVPVLGAALLVADAESAVIVLVTMPIIPVFMVLIGLATRSVQRAQWGALTGLATRFLAIVDGLGTLTLFGRQHRQAAAIERATEDYRRRTMSVLRVTFVSGFVLELAGTLAVAVVAVAVGVRLIDGTLPLGVALFVLLLVPDVFAPVRRVGAEFHASADGVAAADDLFALVGERAGVADAPRAAVAPVAVASVGAALAPQRLELRGVGVRRGDALVLRDLDVTVSAGRITALAGPSGAGKSSAIAALLGFVAHEGALLVDGRPVPDVRGLVAWVPQAPSLAQGTIAANVALGIPAADVDPAAIAHALALAAAPDLDPSTSLGVRGAGLSGGQAQRVAIARAVLRALTTARPFLVLDEPTSGLDAATEARVMAGLRRLADAGHGILVVSHRDAVLAAADRVVTIGTRPSAHTEREHAAVPAAGALTGASA